MLFQQTETLLQEYNSATLQQARLTHRSGLGTMVTCTGTPGRTLDVLALNSLQNAIMLMPADTKQHSEHLYRSCSLRRETNSIHSMIADPEAKQDTTE